MSDPSFVPPWYAPLVGVAVGFVLAEGSRYLCYRWVIVRDKRAIKTELRSILSQLPQKRDVLTQAIESLRADKLLPTRTVRAVVTGYSTLLPNLYPHLNLLQRNCLHVIYERLRVADEITDSFEEDFLRAVREKVMKDPWGMYSARLGELLESYQMVEDLAKSYLDGNPIDVFQSSRDGR